MDGLQKRPHEDVVAKSTNFNTAPNNGSQTEPYYYLFVISSERVVREATCLLRIDCNRKTKNRKEVHYSPLVTAV